MIKARWQFPSPRNGGQRSETVWTKSSDSQLERPPNNPKRPSPIAIRECIPCCYTGDLKMI
jgi:hypothetical protein